jgi:dihydrofolate synthase/folylpolyglutamate synthase
MGRDFDAWEERGRLMVQMPDRLLDLPPPSLFGGYQFENAGLAVAAALTFDRTLSEEVLAKGVSSAVWPARFQRLTKGRWRRSPRRGAQTCGSTAATTRTPAARSPRPPRAS